MPSEVAIRFSGGEVYDGPAVTATQIGIIDQLLASEEPAVRYLARVQVLGEKPDSPSAKRERRLIPDSPRVRTMLSEMRPANGLIRRRNTYDKWLGAHWVMTFLSELGYPPGDKRLAVMADRCANWALALSAKMIDGRWRRCASQQAYALLYLPKLGFCDERCDQIADLLMQWQWPDGGWNCDKHPDACHSSFHESLLPMRALFHFAKESGRADVRRSAKKAA